eukprot:5226211-Amphidinium_carterae.3
MGHRQAPPQHPNVRIVIATQAKPTGALQRTQTRHAAQEEKQQSIGHCDAGAPLLRPKKQTTILQTS